MPDRRRELGEDYEQIRSIAASPRQFGSVIEHLELLRDIAGLGKSRAVAEDLARLVGELR